MNRAKQNNRTNHKRGGRGFAALIIFVLILLAVGGYFLSRKTEPKKQAVPPVVTQQPRPQPTVVEPPKPSQPEKPDQPKTKPAPPEQAVPEQPESVPDKSGKARLAIIIDDMGTSMQEARSLASIGVPVTFSIIPRLRSFKEVAAYAASNGIETMIHMPMQPKEWPQRRLEANGLLLSMDDSEIIARLEEYMAEVPKAIGANNHMGSRFTEDEAKMKVVLQALQGQGKFFIDSVTSPKSVGARLAKEMGMKTGRRNVFLDNEQNRNYIKGQLDQAVRLAKKTGSSIAICHPHPATIKTLQELLPTLQARGVTLVSASQLVR